MISVSNTQINKKLILFLLGHVILSKWYNLYPILPSENFPHHVLQCSNLFMSNRQPFVEGLHTRPVRSFLAFSIQLSLGGFSLRTECVCNRNERCDELEAH